VRQSRAFVSIDSLNIGKCDLRNERAQAAHRVLTILVEPLLVRVFGLPPNRLTHMVNSVVDPEKKGQSVNSRFMVAYGEMLSLSLTLRGT
jgi:hypothetical protein